MSRTDESFGEREPYVATRAKSHTRTIEED